MQKEWERGNMKLYLNYLRRSFYLVRKDEKTEVEWKELVARLGTETEEKRVAAMSQHFERAGGRLGEFVCRLLKEYPLSEPQVLRVLFERFPYKKLPTELQYFYFRLMLETARNSPSTEERLLEFCVEKFLQLDVDARAPHKRAIILDAGRAQDKYKVFER